MKQIDRFIYYYVRIRYRLSVPKAALMLGVTAATWRSWEHHASNMAQSRWTHFNQVFDTHLSPDNVGGPTNVKDLEHYLELLDALDEPKPKRNRSAEQTSRRVEQTREACKALRQGTTQTRPNLSAYDASDLVGVTLAQWQRWESGRSPAKKKDLDKIQAATKWQAERQAYHESGGLHPCYD